MTAAMPEITKSQPEALAELLRCVLPGVRVEVDEPADHAAGLWYLDVKLAGHEVTIEWSSQRGFGISSRSDVGYGELPDERFSDLPSALARVVNLLRAQENTLPPPASLAEVRSERGLSQVELAKRLKVQQSSISKFENRDDVRIRTILSVIQAMGGEVDVIVRFSDGFCRRLEFQTSKAQSR